MWIKVWITLLITPGDKSSLRMRSCGIGGAVSGPLGRLNFASAFWFTMLAMSEVSICRAFHANSKWPED